MGYTNIDIPMILDYPKIEIKRVYRTGAEEEYCRRGEMGVFMPKGEESVIAEKYAVTFTKPFAEHPYRFVTPHPSLTTFLRYSKNKEVDPDFKLRFQRIPLSDSLDPDSSKDTQLLKR